MRTDAFEAGDVFTSQRVGGNPPVVFPHATSPSDGDSSSAPPSHAIDIHQGVTMVRPSLLLTSAYRADDGIRARVSGACVPVFSGTVGL